MEFVALLSGENVSLAKSEFLANLEKQEITCAHELKGRLLLFSCENIPSFDDLSLTHEVCEIIDICSKELPFKGSVKVRALKIPEGLSKSASSTEAKAGEILKRNAIKVSFKSAQTLRIYLTKDADFFGKILFASNRAGFMERLPHKRKFHVPTSISPLIARAMVNLARVKKGSSVLDPFCGGGGLLIEAGLVGAKVFGADIDNSCAEGCRKNLESFGIFAGNVQTADALSISCEFDAVITDLPFGRHSKLSSDKNELHDNFMRKLPSLLKKGGFAAVSSDDSLKIPESLDIIDKFEIYVHKSMTRNIHVLKKC